MNLRIVFLGWLVLALFFHGPALVAAQGGCPANVAAVNPIQHQVVAVIPLAAAMPENVAPQIRGDFSQNRVKVPFQPGWLALLSSTEDGTGGICVDDLLGLQAFPSGQVYRHDFRFNGQIVPTMASENVTFLFQPGENELTLTLTDLTAPAASSSALYLVLVVDPNPPTPTLPRVSSAATPVPLPTETPVPTPAPTVTASPTPEPTETVAVVVSDNATATPVDNLEYWLFFGLLVAVAGIGIVLVGGLLVWWWDQQRDRPTGEVELKVNGRPPAGVPTPVMLAEYKKPFQQPVVRIGAAADCDIRVPGTNVPPLLCQFRAQRDQFDQVETVIDLFDPQSQEVLETRVLRSGDVITLHPLSIVYTNYAEQERMVIGGYHV